MHLGRLAIGAGLAALVLVTLVVVSGLSPSWAQTAATTSETASPPANQATEAPGLWTRTVVMVRNEQRRLHGELATAIRGLRAEGSLAAAWSLLVLSFLYGLFHAAGPGHGKAVISTYLLTHERELRRGLLLAWAAALMQAVTAIVLVLGLVAVIGWTRRDAQAAVGTLESVSFALIALLGAALALRALWALRRRIFPRAASPAPHIHDAACGHDHGACGHVHMPSEAQVRQATSLRTSLAIILSIGIRPCSGGVLVLLFAEVLDLRWAGIAAVFAMAVGTALAVSGLAILTLLFRGAAVALAERQVGLGKGLALAGTTVALLGGIVIMGLGTTLFLGSLGPAHPLL